MNAAVQQSPRDIDLANRRSDVWEIMHAKAQDVLEDEWQSALHMMFTLVLSNYQAGDDAQNGDILRSCIADLAQRLRTHRLANEMRDEFLPSWRSRVEP
jgi:hypothetical protein